MKRILLVISFVLITGNLVMAQFGQNKVMYERFNFDVYKTPHFEIYNYLDNITID